MGLLGTAYGIVWSETWFRFQLMVIEMPDGFRSVILAPWNEDARMCITVRFTLEDAQKRCWGMVREDCELRAVQAAVRMSTLNNVKVTP